MSVQSFQDGSGGVDSLDAVEDIRVSEDGCHVYTAAGFESDDHAEGRLSRQQRKRREVIQDSTLQEVLAKLSRQKEAPVLNLQSTLPFQPVPVLQVPGSAWILGIKSLVMGPGMGAYLGAKLFEGSNGKVDEMARVRELTAAVCVFRFVEAIIQALELR